MRPRVSQAARLLYQPLGTPANLRPASTHRLIIYIQEDEDVRPGDMLPHVGYVGVFLRDVVCLVPYRP